MSLQKSESIDAKASDEVIKIDLKDIGTISIKPNKCPYSLNTVQEDIRREVLARYLLQSVLPPDVENIKVIATLEEFKELMSSESITKVYSAANMNADRRTLYVNYADQDMGECYAVLFGFGKKQPI